MWIIFVALLAVWGDLSGATDICAKGTPDKCFVHLTEPIGFPESIEDLDKKCPIMTSMLSCLVDYKNECGIKHPETLDEKLDEVYEMVTEACDKDSEFHQELSVHLPCLEKIVTKNYNTCQPIIQEALETFRGRMQLETDEDDIPEDSEMYKKMVCLYNALEFSCFVADASVTCGSATKELVERVLDRIGFLEALCHADIREEMKGMISAIQSEMEEGLLIKKVVSEI